jgi:hypothetical protein
MKRIIKYIITVLSICLLNVLMVGCNKPSEPIDGIFLYKASNERVVPPGYGLTDPEMDPTPAIVWEFKSSDKILLGIRLSKDFKEEITFTKYTFFNKDNSEELNVGLPEELGPFEPGQIPLINHRDPWTLPIETGHYELRVFLGERIVSKAFFDIVK